MCDEDGKPWSRNDHGRVGRARLAIEQVDAADLRGVIARRDRDVACRSAYALRRDDGRCECEEGDQREAAASGTGGHQIPLGDAVLCVTSRKL